MFFLNVNAQGIILTFPDLCKYLQNMGNRCENFLCHKILCTAHADDECRKTERDQHAIGSSSLLLCTQIFSHTDAPAGIFHIGIICNIILSVIAVAHITRRIFLMVDRIPFFLKIIAVGTFRDKCL